MRTTVELTDAQRAELLRLAAHRGEKGFSGLVQEAIERFLRDEAEAVRRARVEGALAALGSFDEKAGRRMEAHLSAVRGSWR